MHAADFRQPLQGRNALVIGATSANASEVAEALAAAGAKVMLNYVRRQAKAAQLAERIRNRHGQAMLFQADPADAGQLKSLCDVLLAYWGRLDILVDDSGLHAKAVRAALGAERAIGVTSFDCAEAFSYLAGLADSPDKGTC